MLDAAPISPISTASFSMSSSVNKIATRSSGLIQNLMRRGETSCVRPGWGVQLRCPTHGYPRYRGNPDEPAVHSQTMESDTPGNIRGSTYSLLKSMHTLRAQACHEYIKPEHSAYTMKYLHLAQLNAFIIRATTTRGRGN